MDICEIKQLRLYRQHITNPADKYTVCHDLLGLQAQFMANVYYALKGRCNGARICNSAPEPCGNAAENCNNAPKSPDF